MEYGGGGGDDISCMQIARRDRPPHPRHVAVPQHTQHPDKNLDFLWRRFFFPPHRMMYGAVADIIKLPFIRVPEVSYVIYTHVAFMRVYTLYTSHRYHIRIINRIPMNILYSLDGACLPHPRHCT